MRQTDAVIIGSFLMERLRLFWFGRFVLEGFLDGKTYHCSARDADAYLFGRDFSRLVLLLDCTVIFTGRWLWRMAGK